MYMKCVEMACLAEKLDFRRQVILYIVVKRDFVDHFEFSKGIEPVKIMGHIKDEVDNREIIRHNKQDMLSNR